MDKSKHDSIKAEMEYNLRAADYNVEILKNQIENLNHEMTLMKKQTEKQKKCVDLLRQTNDRVQQDLEHYKKLYINKNKSPVRQKNNENQVPLNNMTLND